MFIHLFIYRAKRLVKDMGLFFWTALFPIVLGTLFYVAFYNAGETTDSTFEPIPVAIVVLNDTSDSFEQFVSSLSEGDSAYLSPVYADTQDQADTLLLNGDVLGIFTYDEEISLKIKRNGFQQTILKTILDSYLQTYSMMENTYMNYPETIEAVNSILSDADYLSEQSFGGKSLNNFVNYFYALLAMETLYGSIFAMTNAIEIQPHISPEASRRLIAPTKRSLLIIADFISALTLQMIIYLVTILYLKEILKIELGASYPILLLIGLSACMVGSGLGYFLGVTIKGDENLKSGLSFGIIMASCFFSGLMVGGMKSVVNSIAPWFNYINPATVISDAYYYICIYNNTAEMMRCVLTLFGYSFLLIFLSFVQLRRKKYAYI